MARPENTPWNTDEWCVKARDYTAPRVSKARLEIGERRRRVEDAIMQKEVRQQTKEVWDVGEE